jgi:hypothetical protein
MLFQNAKTFGMPSTSSRETAPKPGRGGGMEKAIFRLICKSRLTVALPIVDLAKSITVKCEPCAMAVGNYSNGASRQCQKSFLCP